MDEIKEIASFMRFTSSYILHRSENKIKKNWRFGL